MAVQVPPEPEVRRWAADEANAKILGRTTEAQGTRWLTSSAASVEFRVEAGYLALDLVSDGVQGNCARYAVYTDGVLLTTGAMLHREQRVVVFADGGRHEATVTLIKLTESSQSYLGVRAICTDRAGTVRPTAPKPLRLEFIGDSITCGYGVDTFETDAPFSTATEDATKAYAYLTARALDADCLLAGYSSFGVHSGWTDSGERNDFSLVPRVYENLCFSWNTTLFSAETWNFERWRPQLIVLNLGTNDASYCTTPERTEAFVQSYVAFLHRLHELNPGAFFVCTIGIMRMGNGMAPAVQEAARRYAKQSGNRRVSFYHFAPQKPQEGLGSGEHPTAATQARCARELAAFLKDVLRDMEQA